MLFGASLNSGLELYKLCGHLSMPTHWNVDSSKIMWHTICARPGIGAGPNQATSDMPQRSMLVPARRAMSCETQLQGVSDSQL